LGQKKARLTSNKNWEIAEKRKKGEMGLEKGGIWRDKRSLSNHSDLQKKEIVKKAKSVSWRRRGRKNKPIEKKKEQKK